MKPDTSSSVLAAIHELTISSNYPIEQSGWWLSVEHLLAHAAAVIKYQDYKSTELLTKFYNWHNYADAANRLYIFHRCENSDELLEAFIRSDNLFDKVMYLHKQLTLVLHSGRCNEEGMCVLPYCLSTRNDVIHGVNCNNPTCTGKMLPRIVISNILLIK